MPRAAAGASWNLNLAPHATATLPPRRLKPASQAPGMFRESHFKVLILSWLLSSLILSHLDALPVIGSWGALFGVSEDLESESRFAFAMLMCVYLIEGCCCNSLAFVSSISTESEQLRYIDSVLRAPPEILWKVENYHYETRIETTWVNGTAHTTSHQERVRTSSFHGQLRIDSWTDHSHEFQDLSGVDLQRYAMTKIRLKAHFDIVDREEYHAQMSHFRNSHRFDRLQDFTETRCILGFKESTMVCSGPQSAMASIMATASVFWFCHLVLPLAFPYRMWLSANSGKIEATISKQIRCSRPPHALGHGGMGALAENSLLKVCV